jgi:outer membrane lipoprotein-sorting protein
MAELHEQESEFSRLLEGMPCNDAPRPEQAEHLREQVLARFDQPEQAEAAYPRWKHALTRGRNLMRRPIPRLLAGAAACLAVLVVWLLLPGRPSAAQAFQQLADAVIQAHTARFKMEVAVEGQAKQKFRAYYLAPGRFREELGLMVNIADFKAGKMMSLMPAQKTALVMNFKTPEGTPKNKLAPDYFERLRELLTRSREAKDNQYERLGEKLVEGRRVVGFRQDSPAGTVTLWGDPKTGTPVRIESVWSGIPRTEVAMTDFEINVVLMRSLFDLTPPPDYKVQSLDVDASEPRENDLVQAFKTCSEIGAGRFPDTLDTAGITKLIIQYTLSHKKEFSDAELSPKLMNESIKIGRGFQFVTQLPESADAHYAGKGVTRDVKNRPIFWYKPEGARQYRVLYADLSLRDADSAPQVAGATRVEKASKMNRPTKE